MLNVRSADSVPLLVFFASFSYKSSSNAASSTVAKRVLNSGSTDEAASFIFVY